MLLILSGIPWGPWAWKPFCLLHLLIIGNWLHSASMVFAWVLMGRFKYLLIREGRGCRDKRGAAKLTIVQPWGRVLAPPQGMHIAISLSCFADTAIPTRWDMLTACCPQACRPHTSRNQEVGCADFNLPPHHQKNFHELITPSSLNHSYKISHYPF